MRIFDTYFHSSVNPGDPVGTLPFFLGGNGAGINNPSMSNGEFGYMFSRGVRSIANGKDPTNPSPHSGYPCVIGCGDENFTPNIENYYTPNSSDGKIEHPRAVYYQSDFSNENGQMTIDMGLLPNNMKQSDLSSISKGSE